MREVTWVQPHPMLRARRICTHLRPLHCAQDDEAMPIICGRVAFPSVTVVLDATDDEKWQCTFLNMVADDKKTFFMTHLEHPTRSPNQQSVGTRCQLLSYDRASSSAVVRGESRALLKRAWWEPGGWEWAEVKALPTVVVAEDEKDVLRRSNLIRQP